MSDSALVTWNDELSDFDFGPRHPLNPVRVQLALRLSEELGLFAGDGVRIEREIPVLSDRILARTHGEAYMNAVREASRDAHFRDLDFGLGTEDVPVFEGMHTAAARICGASVTGARAVHEGRVEHAVNLFGGLHHAMPDKASGFCVYNDPAVAINWLLDQGVERVAYLDVDVHHGDGVQAAFWDEPRVLTMSIHESPATLFPGTGWATEVGGPRAVGTAVNLPLPAGTGDQGWLRGLHAVFKPMLEAFKPQFIVSQHGCDGHFEDPLASMALSIDGMRMTVEAIHRWVHQYAGGKWLALGGGGYEWVDVVPRAWTNVVAEVVGAPVPPETAIPAGFREYVTERMGRPGPARMTDGYEPWPKPWTMGYDPSDPVDGAIAAARAAVFPYAGLATDSFGGF